MLRIHDKAIELVREVMPLIREIERCDGDLAGQARRAVMSTPLILPRGASRPASDARCTIESRWGRHERRGPHSEVAEAAEYITAPSDQLKNKFDQVIGTLHRCLFKRA
jgi:hypothetical protein